MQRRLFHANIRCGSRDARLPFHRQWRIADWETLPVAEICVVHLSEDEPIVERLVALLRRHWSVWWDQDINQGDWELAVRLEIGNASAIVPVLSEHATSARLRILKDEMQLANNLGKPIFPFLIGQA